MATWASERPSRSKWRKRALVTVPVVVVLGMLSGWLSNSGFSNDWFLGLRKPSFMPPGWVFGVVWTTLYVMMGLALAMVLAAPRSPARLMGLGLFAIQLLLNFAWSPTFFGAGMIGRGMVIILALDLLVAATIVMFWRVRPLAGALLLPYLAWLCLASALNWEIGRLNPGADKAPLAMMGA